ncbi:MAG: hypothetical protein N2255_08140, partial [Kiritimatiellae bacterium]|nr:hypothetical protein [Kiritimatiellia bacterium]
YFGPHRLGYQIQTVSANSILVLCPGETSAFLRAKRPDRAWVSGGQRVIRPTSFSCVNMQHFLHQLDHGPHLRRAEITAWHSEPKLFDYVAADITAAYNSTRWAEPGAAAKVSLVTRQFLYLRPERAFVIFDRAETTNEKFLPKFLLHTKSKPMTSTEEVLVGQVDNGILVTQDRVLVSEARDGRLTQLVLLPQDARILKIGGENFCFYAEVDSDQDDGFDGLNLVQGSGYRDGADRQTNHWRVEVEPGKRGRSTRFLNVLLPRLKAEVQSLPQVELLAVNEDVTAVAVGTTTVIFSTSGTPLKSVALTDVPAGRCLLLDAVRGTTYRFGEARFPSDKEGIVFIPATPGRRFFMTIETE